MSDKREESPYLFLHDHYTGGLPSVRAYAIITGDGDLESVWPTHKQALRHAEGCTHIALVFVVDPTAAATARSVLDPQE